MQYHRTICIFIQCRDPILGSSGTPSNPPVVRLWCTCWASASGLEILVQKRQLATKMQAHVLDTERVAVHPVFLDGKKLPMTIISSFSSNSQLSFMSQHDVSRCLADKRLVGVWENEPEDRDIRHEKETFCATVNMQRCTMLLGV